MARTGKRLEHVPGAEGGTLEDGPVEMASSVAQRQAGDDAPGVGVVEGIALAREVGEHDEALASGRYRGRFGQQCPIGNVADQTAEPLGQRSGRGHAAGQAPRARQRADQPHIEGSAWKGASMCTSVRAVPYMSMASPGPRTPMLVASAQASMVPTATGVPARSQQYGDG